MDWNDLRFFLAVARDGQMLSAAQKLGVSQAKLNRHLSALESALDTILFNRSTAGCELTPQGVSLMEHALNIEAEALQVSSTLKGHESNVSGTVRIGAPDGFGVAFLAPRLRLLNEQFPELTIQLVPVPRVFSLSQREADIAITVDRPEKGRLRVRKLTDYSLSLFASPDYLKKHGKPETLDDLKNHRLVGYVDDLIFTPALDYAAQFSRDWHSNIEVSSALGQFEVVRSGGGIGILHDFMVHDHAQFERILPAHSLSRSYWTVWHESMNNSRRIREVAKFLQTIAEKDKSLFVSRP